MFLERQIPYMGLPSDTVIERSFKHCMVITSVELSTVIPVPVNLTLIQGQNDGSVNLKHVFSISSCLIKFKLCMIVIYLEKMMQVILFVTVCFFKGNN